MSDSTTRAVSPVIAVILMVAVTVVLSAAIGAFVFDLGQSTTDGTAQTLGVSTSQSGGVYTVQVVTGTADELRVFVNGALQSNISNPKPGDQTSVSVSKGDSITIVSVSEGDTRVVQQQESSTGIVAPTDGLIGHWKFDEGSGGTAVDSAESNDGTISGANWTTTAKTGSYALDFNGSGDYVDVGQPYTAPDDYTIAAWVNADSLNDHHMIMMSGNATNEHIQLFHHKQNTNWRMYVRDTASNGQWTSGKNVTTNEWVHLAATYDNESTNTITIYVNGNPVNSTSFTNEIVTPDQSTLIGARHDNDASGTPQHFWDGVIDDARIYNRVLSDSEVKQLYDATK